MAYFPMKVNSNLKKDYSYRSGLFPVLTAKTPELLFSSQYGAGTQDIWQTFTDANAHGSMTNAGTNQYIGYNLKTKTKISSFIYVSGDAYDNMSKTLITMNFQGSDDGNTWTTLKSTTLQCIVKNPVQILDATANYCMYRILRPSNGAIVSVMFQVYE